MGMKARSVHVSMASFIAAAPAERKADLEVLDTLIRANAPTLTPVASSTVMGYGRFHYRYASGREGEAFKIRVVCNQGGLSLHCLAADEQGYIAERFAPRLGKAQVGKSCVRFKRLSDLELTALAELVRATARAAWA